MKLVLGLLARNPLIITCLLGITANVISLPIPAPLLATMEVMGNAALALGLFAVGAALNLSALTDRLSLIAITTVAKLALKPIVFIGLVVFLPMPEEMFLVGLVCAAVPGAPSSYILARQLGGNAELMAGLITASTLFGFLSLPLWLFLAA